MLASTGKNVDPGLSFPDFPPESCLPFTNKDLPDRLPRVLAGHILARWDLDAEVVVLSACQSGLGHYDLGDSYARFVYVLFLRLHRGELRS